MLHIGPKCALSIIFLLSSQSSCGLFLLDDSRVSQLSPDTGKTKKRLPSLAPIQSRLALTCSSPNGAFLGGLTTSGDLFLWHKDTEVLQTFETPLSRSTSPAEKKATLQEFQGKYTYTSNKYFGST